MANQFDPMRRNLLTGNFPSRHISSAVVSVLPAHHEGVVAKLARMEGVEVHHQTNSKIVIVMEAPESGMLGSRLMEIANMEGVLSANMVFEHFEAANDGV